MRRSGLASLAMFYHDTEENQKKDLRGLLSSVLIQLCHQSDSHCDILSKLYSEHGNGSQRPSDHALVCCFNNMVNLPQQAPIFFTPSSPPAHVETLFSNLTAPGQSSGNSNPLGQGSIQPTTTATSWMPWTNVQMHMVCHHPARKSYVLYRTSSTHKSRICAYASPADLRLTSDRFSFL